MSQILARGLFDATTAGLVPASGGGTGTFLRADGTWAGAGGGGGTVADADYGDVVVSSTGTVWTVDSLPESRITGLVADLAAKANTSSLAAIATSGSATDLVAGSVPAARIANNTITNAMLAQAAALTLVGNNTAGTANRADLTVTQVLAMLGITLGQFGSGADGAVVMDGVSAAPGCTLAGSTYTATRDIVPTTLVINVGITFKTDGYRVFGRTSIEDNGTISHNGLSGAGAAPGAGSASSRPLPASLPGGSGGTTIGSAGNNGQASGTSPRGFDSTAANGGAPGVSGTAGGVGHGGGGGGGGGAPTNGGAGGQVTVVTAQFGDIQAVVYDAISGRRIDGTQYSCGSGGGGGGAGGSAGFGQGGGGGAGGGWIVICSPSITGSGAITALGGNGAGGAAATGVGGGGAGGGGGGGGVVILQTATLGITPLVTGGSGGAGAGGGTGGVGGNGGNGGDGLVVVFS